MRSRTHRLSLALIVALAASTGAQSLTSEHIDLDAVYRIKEEGSLRSQVMNTASYLTDVYGPRLTNSPDFRVAADWAQKTMREWGLANVHTEPFTFGRGWRNGHTVAEVLAPSAYS